MKTQEANVALPERQQKGSLHKLLYEKPRLGKVQLFADQVLGSCMLTPPCTTGTPAAS